MVELTMFKVGDKVKNRFNDNKTGTVLGYDGCLLMVEIAGRSYEFYAVNFNWCVPSDWILA